MSWLGTLPAVLALTLQCLDGSGMSSGPVFRQKIGRLARWDLYQHVVLQTTLKVGMMQWRVQERAPGFDLHRPCVSRPPESSSRPSCPGARS